MQLLSETLLLTSESAHLTPLPASGYLFWQVSPKQSPLTQILGMYSSLDMEGPFLLGLSSVEHSVLFLAPSHALEKALQLYTGIGLPSSGLLASGAYTSDES